MVDGLATYLVDQDAALLGTLSAEAVRLLPRLFPALVRVPFFSDAAAASHSLTEGAPHELRARDLPRVSERCWPKVAERRPLVVAIDDVQWADGGTRALLAELLAPPSPPRILLICARRLSRGRGRAPEPRADHGARRRRAVRASAPAFPVKRSRRSRLYSRGRRRWSESSSTRSPPGHGGHPLFLQELVRRSARGGARFASGHVPADDALWDRVALLGQSEQRVVHAVAVAEVPTSLDLIATAAAVPRHELPGLMAALRGANIVKVTGKARDRRVSAYHDRVRKAVIAHPRRRRTTRLARAARARARRGDERDVERLAVHWSGAGDGPRAAGLYREAAERASGALAFDRAVDFYRRSIVLGGESPTERDVVERALATALVNAGRGGESGARVPRARRPGQRPSGDGLRGHAARENASCSGHFAEGAAELRAVLSSSDIRYPQSRFAVVLLILWQRLRIVLRDLAFTPRSPEEIDPRALAPASTSVGPSPTDSRHDRPRPPRAHFHAMGARLSLNLGDPFRAARAPLRLRAHRIDRRSQGACAAPRR